MTYGAQFFDRIEPWYQQNVLVFQDGHQVTSPRPLVHPYYWDLRR